MTLHLRNLSLNLSSVFLWAEFYLNDWTIHLSATKISHKPRGYMKVIDTHFCNSVHYPTGKIQSLGRGWIRMLYNESNHIYVHRTYLGYTEGKTVDRNLFLFTWGTIS